MIILCNTFLPNERMHAIPAVSGKTIKTIPVLDRVIGVVVARILTIVSTDSKILF